MMSLFFCMDLFSEVGVLDLPKSDKKYSEGRFPTTRTRVSINDDGSTSLVFHDNQLYYVDSYSLDDLRRLSIPNRNRLSEIKLSHGGDCFAFYGSSAFQFGKLSGTLQELKTTKQEETCSFSPDDEKVLFCHNDKTCIIWDFERVDEVLKIKDIHKEIIPKGIFHPTDSLLAFASWDRSVSLVDSRTGNLIDRLTDVNQGYVKSIEFSDDNTIIVGGNDRKARYYDIRTLSLLGNVEHDSPILDICCSENNLLAVANTRSDLCIWNINDRIILPHTFGASQAVLSKNGGTLVVWPSNSDGPITMYDGNIRSRRVKSAATVI